MTLYRMLLSWGCAALLTVGACGFGLKGGTGVSRSSSPVSLASAIGEPARDADASLSSTFGEVEAMAEKSHVRAMMVLGAGNGHARYRSVMAAGKQQVVGKDDNVLLRAGAGVAFAPVRFGRLAPVPYLLYTTNFESGDNAAKHAWELGVDLEIGQHVGDADVTGAVVVGLALLRETGLSAADFGSGDTYQSEYTTTGILVTFGVRLLGVELSR